jgi:hypothetical protein
MALSLANIRNECLFTRMSNVFQVELKCSVKKHMTILLIYFSTVVFYRHVCIILTTFLIILIFLNWFEQKNVNAAGVKFISKL